MIGLGVPTVATLGYAPDAFLHGDDGAHAMWFDVLGLLLLVELPSLLERRSRIEPRVRQVARGRQELREVQRERGARA